MKGFFRQLLFLAVYLSIFLLARRLFEFDKTGISKRLEYLLFGILASMFVLNILSDREWFMRKTRGRKGFLLIGFGMCLSTILIANSYRLFFTYRDLFSFVLGMNKKRWKGSDYESDARLGYRLRPDSRSFILSPDGDSIWSYHDHEGFRIPASDTLIEIRRTPVDILFLGCSFTYGYMCKAEDTYPHLVAKAMGYRYINAAVCGYGASQMLEQARKLIGRYRPRYVVFQHSDWLLKRSQSVYAPNNTATPIPYFRLEDDSLVLQYPVDRSLTFELIEKALKSDFGERPLSFFFTEFIPYIAKKEFYGFRTAIRLKTGHLKRPNVDKRSMALRLYPDFVRIANEYGARPIVFHIGDQYKIQQNAQEGIDTAFVNALGGVAIVDAVKPQLAYLEEHPELNPANAYLHCRIRAADTVIMDHHPNPLAHSILARTLLTYLQTVPTEMTETPQSVHSDRNR